ALRRPPADLEGKRAAEAELQRVEALWAEVHRLADQLDLWPFAMPADLVVSTAEVRQQFAALVKSYQGFANGLGRDPQDGGAPACGADLEAARAAAHPDADLRIRLWRQAQKALQRLAEQGGRRTTVPPEVTPQQIREQAVHHARWHGRLALAALGRDWFDAPRRGAFDEVRFRLEEFSAQAEGWDWLAQAGDQIGRRFCDLPRAGTDNRAARDAPAPAKAAAPRRGAVPLLGAERHGRLLDGTTNGTLADNPAEPARRWRYQQMLLRLADRTLA